MTGENCLHESSSVELSKVLEQIRKGQAVGNAELLPLLVLESKEERFRVNFELAAAYFERFKDTGNTSDLSNARSCIDRALLLSNYEPTVLPLLIQVNEALNDVSAIRWALKQTALQQAARGNFDKALDLCDQWMYAYTHFAHKDIHTFDPEIISCVERMAALHRFENTARPSLNGRKIRVAYLMHGLLQVGSVLVKIDRVFGRLHDKSRFEVGYFSIDDENAVASSDVAQAAIKDLTDNGCHVAVAPNVGTVYERLLSVARKINDFEPDILVTSAALATFKNYFVTCLKPAPLTIAFNQGSTPQFSWHAFDHTISWFSTTIPDCPSDCSNVKLELDLPRRDNVQPSTRAELGAPENVPLLVMGGRWHKFQNAEFWRFLGEALHDEPQLHLMIIGTAEDQIAFLDQVVKNEVLSRIHFQAWSDNYLSSLAAADFVLDSYPIGGGVFLMEAMSLGIPVISFHHDYVKLYSNDDCSGGEEIVGLPELVVDRRDFAELKATISKLATDSEYRKRLGQRCEERIRERHGNSLRMVQRCEEVYERLVRENERHSSTQRGPVVDDLEQYKVFLVDQAETLNRRENEVALREQLYNARPAVRIARALRNRLRRVFPN